MDPKIYTSKRVFFEWKTEPPTTLQSRISPPFSFSDVEWHFALETKYDHIFSLMPNVFVVGNIVWNMSLKTNAQVSPKVGRSMQMTVYIQNKDGKLDYIGLKTKHTDVIWTAYECKVLQRRDDYIVDGFLTFIFVFDSPIQWISELTMKNEADKQGHLLSCQEEFTKDIRSLLEHSEHYDVIFLCDDQRKFYTHKCILAARSDVFAAMFRCDMSENSSGVVHIRDIDSSVFNQFLQYIYSGKTDELTQDSAFPLYVVADKYNVHCLKRKCSSVFIENLTEDNVLGIFLIAERFMDGELMEAAVSFVAGRKTFLRSAEWKTFAEQYPAIGTRVYQSALDLLSPP